MVVKYRISSFVHLFTSNKEDVCLFQAIRLKKVYGSSLLSNLYRFFLVPRSLEDFLVAEGGYSHQTVSPLLRELIRMGYLIPAGQDDATELTNLRNKLAKKYKPICMYLLTSTYCNLTCKYCSVRYNKVLTGQKMSLEIALQAVEEFFRDSADPKYICFFGGEPLVNFPIIREVVRYVNRKYGFNKFKINTNGTLITDEIAHFLAQHNFTIGVSIDGPPNIHDSLRKIMRSGNGSFSLVERGWRKLKAHGCKDLGIVTVLCSVNAKRIREVVNYLLETFDPTTINLEPIESIPDKALEMLRPSPTEVASALIHNFLELESRKHIRDNIISRYLYHFTAEEPNLYGCASHWGARVVDTNGNIGPCFNFTSSKYFSTTSAFSEWRDCSPITMKDCWHCPAIGICGGICAAHSYCHTGTIWGTDQEYSCEYVRKVLEWMIWDLKFRLKSTSGKSGILNVS